MTSPQAVRICLNAPKFWIATKGMSESDVEVLVEDLMQMAQEQRIAELSLYDFISIGHAKRASESD